MEDRQLRRFIERRTVTIDEVNMSQRFISAIDQYGTHLQISTHLNDGGITAIPAPQETWLVARSGNDWFLDKRGDDGSESVSLNDLQPGDRRIESSGALFLNGTPIGSSSVVSNLPVLEPGVKGQIQCGHVLTVDDFTSLGLSTPIAIYNLGDGLDSSGNGRHLTNKGAVTFGHGITGVTPEAAVFHGGTTDALYYADTGPLDPFRIPYGSWGCWFRTAKTGVQQWLLSKDTSPGARSYQLYITSTNNSIGATISIDGATLNTTLSQTSTFVTDDRWHFAVATYDSAVLTVYLDGQFEGSSVVGGLLFRNGAGTFDIGSAFANATTNGVSPMFGAIDEAFVTTDILREDQIRILYATKLAHKFRTTPTVANVSVQRLRKRGAYTTSDFSTQPLRLHNFTSGSMFLDEGSQNAVLTENSPGAIRTASAVDGSVANAVFGDGSSSYMSSSDAGLPTTGDRSMGIWFRTTSSTLQGMIQYGTESGEGLFSLRIHTGGTVMAESWSSVRAQSTATYNDGLWHFAVVTYQATPFDGLRFKLYVDGQSVASAISTAITTVLSGATGFHIGRLATFSFSGSLDGAFLTNYAMPSREIKQLYANGSRSSGSSPKNAGDHVEKIDADSVYAVFDSLESQNLVSIQVSG
jgi:hypothetical protein